MDQIKIKIEVGGFLISDNGQGRILPAKVGGTRKLFWGNTTWTGGSIPMDAAFEIESDDPGKLHKFTGMKYEGLVDRQQDVTQMIAEFAKKFDGCTVLYSSAKGCAVHGKKLHFIDDKSLLFSTIHTTEGKVWNLRAQVCKVCGVMLGQCHNKLFIETNCGRIIAEFTRIMNDEDRA